MPLSGLPRPLPECARCKAPLPRAVWRTRRVCADCATPAERMAAVQTAHELARKAEATTVTVQTRIDQLAAKRAARAARSQT